MSYGVGVARTKGFDPDTAVDRALEVFWSNGYAATSAQDLVDGTGLGRGSLYNTFTSKHALYEQVLRRYHDRNTRDDVAVLDGPGPLRERLREMLLGVVESELGDPTRRGCLAVNAAIELAGRDDAVTTEVARVFDRVEDALHAAIVRAQAAGELDGGRDARALARFLLGAIYGLRVLGKATRDRGRLVDIVETTLAAI